MRNRSNARRCPASRHRNRHFVGLPVAAWLGLGFVAACGHRPLRVDVRPPGPDRAANAAAEPGSFAPLAAQTPPPPAANGNVAMACPPQTALSSQGRCVPLAWHCSPLSYGGGLADGCDCGCGVPDPDCALSGAKSYCSLGGQPAEVAQCSACAPPAFGGSAQ